MGENNKPEEFYRIKTVRYTDPDKMTPYQKWRVVLGIIQILATLGVPFVIVAINEYLKVR